MTDWKQEALQAFEKWRGSRDMSAHPIELSEAKHVQEGFVQDFLRGAARMARRMAKDTLIARFGAAPEEVMARLEAIADPEVLRRLAWEATWKVQSLEDFIALLPDGEPG